MSKIEAATDDNGYEFIKLYHPKTISYVKVYLFGGNVVEYHDLNGKEILFLSSEAIFDGSTPLRGGIPIVFPQFDKPNPSIPKHGFARTSMWVLDSFSRDEGKIVLKLEDSVESREMWDFTFKLLYSITIGDNSLSCHLALHHPISVMCQVLLHNYFLVGNVEEVGVKGLEECEYLDKLIEFEKFKDDNQKIIVRGEVDRIYFPPLVRLNKDNEGVRVCLEEDGEMVVELTAWTNQPHNHLNPQMVIWNPWIDKSRGMADMGDEEYKHMICMEPGIVSEPFLLEGVEEEGEFVFSQKICSFYQQEEEKKSKEDI